MRDFTFKLIIFSLLLSLCGTAAADDISFSEAEQVAASFFGRPHAAKAQVKMVRKGLPLTRSGGHPAYYIFSDQDGEGFVIIAGDDRAMPVLGFSRQGRFDRDRLPEAMTSHLSDLEKEIRKAAADGAPATADVVQAWKDITEPRPVIVHETARWGQGSPFNDLCPEIGGTRSLAGCVAVACAIVMRYHRWPEQGSGTLPEYVTATSGIPMESLELGHRYDWEQMPLDPTSCTPAQQEELSVLLRDLGYTLMLDYGTRSTVGYLIDIPRRFTTYMNGSPRMKVWFRKSCALAEWHSRIREELRENGPLVYSGSNSRGGHAFVLDGWAEGDYYSVNWGWNGDWNGFFRLDALGTGSENYHYTDDNQMVTGFGKHEGTAYLETLRFYSGEDHPAGILGYDRTLPAGTEQTVTLSSVFNEGWKTFDGKLRLTVTDSTGKARLAYPEVKARIAGYYFRDYPVKILTPATSKGERLRLYYQAGDSREWKQVIGPEEARSEILLTGNGGMDDLISLEYDARTRTMFISSRFLESLNLTLKKAKDGTDCSGNIIPDGPSAMHVDCSDLQGGEYVLEFHDREFGKHELRVKLNETRRRD